MRSITRRPGRFDRAVPGLVQEAFSEPGPLRVHAPARAGAPAAGQTATDQNRMGDRFHGMARRAEGSGLNRGVRFGARATTELTVAGDRWFESISLQRRVCKPPVPRGRTTTGD